MWYDNDGFPDVSGLSGMGAPKTAAERKAEADARKAAAAARQAANLSKRADAARNPAQAARLQQQAQAAASRANAIIATTPAVGTQTIAPGGAGPSAPKAAVLRQIQNEIKKIDQQLATAKAKGIDAPDWVTYRDCLKARLLDAARQCNKPGTSIAKIVADAKKAPKKAAEDVAQIKQDDGKEVSKLQTAIAAFCGKIKDSISKGWKNPKSRAVAMKKAQKYGLTIDAQGNVSGDCKPPAAIKTKVVSAATTGRKKKAARQMKGLSEGEEIVGTDSFIDTTGATDPTGGLLTGGGSDSNALLLTLLASGDTQPPKGCDGNRGQNKPVCVMFRMQQSNKEMFVLLIMFLTEMQNDMAELVAAIAQGGAGASAGIDPNTGLPYNIDPNTGLPYGYGLTPGSGVATGDVPFVTGPIDDGGYDPYGGGLIDTGLPAAGSAGGGVEMVTGPSMVDESLAYEESFVDGSFNEGAPMQYPTQRVVVGPLVEGGQMVPYGPAVDDTLNYDMFSESAPFMVDEGMPSAVDVGFDYDPNAEFVSGEVDIFGGGDFGLFGRRPMRGMRGTPWTPEFGMSGMGCNGDILCDKCAGNGIY